MGKQSNRSKGQQKFVNPSFRENRNVNQNEDAEASTFLLVVQGILLVCAMLYEHIYPTNEFRKRREKDSPPNFFSEQSSTENTLDNSYSLLGVTRGECSLDEVKKSYRKLALKYHPDRQSKMTEAEKDISELKMKEINMAYEAIQLELVAPASEPEREPCSAQAQEAPAEQSHAQQDRSTKFSKSKKKSTHRQEHQHECEANEKDLEKERKRAEEEEAKMQYEWYMKTKKAEQETLRRMAQSASKKAQHEGKLTAKKHPVAKNVNKHQGKTQAGVTIADVNSCNRTEATSTSTTNTTSSCSNASASESFPSCSNAPSSGRGPGGSGEESSDSSSDPREAGRLMFDSCTHELAALLRLKLPLLFGEALAEKGDDFFARLHECVLDEGGNTLMHYCVYYDLDVIGSQLLETSGNKWWRLVLQTNKAGRNAIEEARWLDAVGETESPFLVRISSLTATAAEQRAQLEVQDERSLDLSVLSNLVLTLGAVYMTSQLFLFSHPSPAVSESCSVSVGEGGSSETQEGEASACPVLAYAPPSHLYFGIGLHERLLISLVLTYLPGAEGLAVEISLGLLVALKCFNYVFLSWASYWYLVAIGAAVGTACLTDFGRGVCSKVAYYAPLLGLAAFVSFCGYLGHTHIPKLPMALSRKAMQWVVLPMVGKPPEAPSGGSFQSDSAEEKSLMGHINSFFHGMFFRNILLITTVWMTLGLFQLACNCIAIPLVSYMFSFVWVVLKMVGVGVALLMIVNSGLKFFGKGMACVAYCVSLFSLLIWYLFF